MTLLPLGAAGKRDRTILVKALLLQAFSLILLLGIVAVDLSGHRRLALDGYALGAPVVISFGIKSLKMVASPR